MDHYNSAYVYINGLITVVWGVAAHAEQFWWLVKRTRKMSKSYFRYHEFVECRDA